MAGCSRGRWNRMCRTCGSLLAGLALLGGAIGCGAPVAEKPANSESRSTSSPGENHERDAPSLPLMGKTDQGSAPLRATPAVGSAQKEEEMVPHPMPSIPTEVAKGLDSPDARARYRALDYWEREGNQAPLDPVFEAMEDEDPVVRTKATAIIEQRWVATQEQE